MIPVARDAIRVARDGGNLHLSSTVLKKVSHEELKKKSEHKCVMISNKPWKATRKVTLSSSKSRAFNKFLSSRLYWKSRRLGRRAPNVRASRGVWEHSPPENFET